MIRAGHVYAHCKTPLWPGAPWHRNRIWRCDCGRFYTPEWISAAGTGMWTWTEVDIRGLKGRR